MHPDERGVDRPITVVGLEELIQPRRQRGHARIRGRASLGRCIALGGRGAVRHVFAPINPPAPPAPPPADMAPARPADTSAAPAPAARDATEARRLTATSDAAARPSFTAGSA